MKLLLKLAFGHRQLQEVVVKRGLGPFGEEPVRANEWQLVSNKFEALLGLGVVPKDAVGVFIQDSFPDLVVPLEIPNVDLENGLRRVDRLGVPDLFVPP